MRWTLPALTLVAMFSMTPTANSAEKKENHIYELRVYYAPPGKLDALHARFKNHTTKLFEKHGMTNVGYFVPVGDNKEGKLVYLLSYPNKEARNKSWAAFLEDPVWKKAHADSEKDGKLVDKIEASFLEPTNYSPALKVGAGKDKRVFELRTYTASKGNLAGLDARFRDHTIKLFEKYGMTNLAYWHLLPGQSGADAKLIYLLAHASPEAAKKSFDEFRQDPEWVKARKESEEKAGGSLTEPKGGVVSEFLTPTDYSPLK